MTECDKEASVIVEGPFPQTGNPKIDRQLESFLQLENGWLDGARLETTAINSLGWQICSGRIHGMWSQPCISARLQSRTFKLNGLSTPRGSHWR